MSNKVEVVIEIDDTRANQALKRTNNEIDNLTNAEKRAAGANNALATGFSSTSIALGAVAVGFGLVVNKGLEYVRMSAAAADANRVLTSSATEAGLAYATAVDQAERFAKRSALSRTSGEQTYASILAFTQGAGRADQSEEFSRKFQDLAAARGVKSSELADVARQFNALSDEGIERVLKANPSAFYDQYAASIGKVAGALTEADKRAAIFDQTNRQSAIFTGAADARLASTEGQIDALSSGFEDATTAIGDAITQNKEFNDALRLTVGLIQSVGAGSIDMKKQLSQPGVTPEQVAKAQTDTLFNNAFDIFTGAATAITSPVSVPIVDLFILGPEGAQHGPILERIVADIFNATFYVGERRYQEALSKARTAQAELDQAEKDRAQQAEQREAERAAKVASAAAAATQRVRDAFWERQMQIDLQRDEERRQSEERAAEQALEATKRGYEKQLEYLRDVQGEADQIFKAIAGAAGSKNPFVRLFSEADEAARRFQTTSEKLRETYGDMASDVIGQLKEMTAAQRDALAGDALEQRLKDQLEAQRLRREAEGLGKQNGGQKRDDSFLDYVNNDLASKYKDSGKSEAEVARAVQQDKLDALYKRKMEGTYFGDFHGLFPELFGGAPQASPSDVAINGAQADLDLVKRLTQQAIERGLDPAAAARLADQQVLDVTGKLSPEALGGNDGLRDARRDALNRQAERVEQREEDARRRQENENVSRGHLKDSIDKLRVVNEDLIHALQEKDLGTLQIQVNDRSSAAINPDQLGKPTR